MPANTSTRTDDMITTFTGIQIRPLNPDPDLITVEDIAHATANSCRFTGHVRSFYSVAQHSCHVSMLVPEEDALWALLHDASEAYLSDIARPVKIQPGFGEVYREAESRLMQAVAARFNLPWPIPESVHWADNVMLRSEQRDLMPNIHRLPGEDYYPRPVVPLSPSDAELAFLYRYYEIVNAQSSDMS